MVVSENVRRVFYNDKNTTDVTPNCCGSYRSKASEFTGLYKEFNLDYHQPMVALIKRFIVLLLLLLQGFTPLVHAHVQSEGTESGLHIDGISVLVNKATQFSSLETIEHSDTVISMSSAMQPKKMLNGELKAFVAISYTSDFIQPLLIEKIVGFSPHSGLNKSSLSLSVIAPRAPPLK